jgi:hypothetical protein
MDSAVAGRNFHGLFRYLAAKFHSAFAAVLICTLVCAGFVLLELLMFGVRESCYHDIADSDESWKVHCAVRTYWIAPVGSFVIFALMLRYSTQSEIISACFGANVREAYEGWRQKEKGNQFSTLVGYFIFLVPAMLWFVMTGIAGYRISPVRLGHALLGLH